MAKPVDVVLHCDKNGIKALVDKYADLLIIKYASSGIRNGTVFKHGK